jgi:hypothetical protein
MCKSFNDVRRNRERRAPHLLTELEPLVRRKRFQRKLMQSDEEIVGALPGHERVMRKCHRTPPDHSMAVPTEVWWVT